MGRSPMLAVGRSRVALGPDLKLVEVSLGLIWLEGSVRLRPGQPVDLVGAWPGLETSAGRARVVCWRIVRLTSAGPFYRGSCRLEA